VTEENLDETFGGVDVGIIEGAIHDDSKSAFTHELEQTNSKTRLSYFVKLKNGAQVEVTQTLFFKKTNLSFEEEPDVNLEMGENTVKYSYRIENWPFKKESNRLELCTNQNASEDARCTKQILTQGDKVLRVEDYFSDKSKAVRDVVKFALVDGKSVEVEVSAGDLGVEERVTVPSFKKSMFYDPNFALLLGGGDSDDPCAKRDLQYTWICLGFLLGALVVAAIIVAVSLITHKSQSQIANEFLQKHNMKNQQKTNNGSSSNLQTQKK